nr:hypothetical protein [Tanacetum cinerariifolium]
MKYRLNLENDMPPQDKACKELVSHLATPTVEEFLGNLTNVEVVSRAYQSLEDEKAVLLAKLDQAKKDYHKLVWEFIATVVRKLHTSIEYRQSLAAPEAKHREIFTMQYPYVQKVASTYHVSMDDLMQISPNVPPPPLKDGVEASSANATDDATRKSSPAV